ncbi:uncharacterized protein EV420DRAFT_1659974 [Desarmillaria tabescens]|uniref:Thioredoxin domain-containing protein n=1 Tax=Armillaria tabescens TaxID=1929756 RepID=A0AA39NPK7_ARMTA|nr:uncharacterized protein EV420DRAFT_1659974 [Desarmillaria tabescens]KAK0469509.1 hypothetical protein EV420DRAFT_1659974 [Desarmillaria tabescens]
MALVLPSTISTVPPKAPRIKRKPVPSIDMMERYPPPDPADPFASLTVLRSRSSTLFGPKENVTREQASYSYRVSRPSSSPGPTTNKDDVQPAFKPVARSGSSHYRRRSLSTPQVPPMSPSPSLVHESFHMTDAGHDGTVSGCPSAASSRSTDSRRRKVSIASISSPMPVSSDAKRPFPSISKRASLDSNKLLKPRPRQGYVSQPESRQNEVRKAIVSSPSAYYPPPPSSTQSHSSSYTNIPTPSSESPVASPCIRGISTPSLRSLVDTPAPSAAQHSSCHSHTSSLPLNFAFPASTEWLPPTPTQLARAAEKPLVASSGLRVPFGTVFARKRVIVIFIRHFWCPLCQDYMHSLASLAPRNADIVIISNGSHALIDKYRQIFGLRFQMYVDPELEVYRALGMGTIANTSSLSKTRARREKVDSYVKRGALGGMAMVVFRALKVGMPMWEKGGQSAQLGGEFVLGPGMTCTWAHRMQTREGHAPVADVLEAAGLPVTRSLSLVAPPVAVKAKDRTRRETMGELRASVRWSVERKRQSVDGMPSNEEKRLERYKSLESIKEANTARRGVKSPIIDDEDIDEVVFFKH